MEERGIVFPLNVSSMILPFHLKPSCGFLFHSEKRLSSHSGLRWPLACLDLVSFCAPSRLSPYLPSFYHPSHSKGMSVPEDVLTTGPLLMICLCLMLLHSCLPIHSVHFTVHWFTAHLSLTLYPYQAHRSFYNYFLFPHPQHQEWYILGGISKEVLA